MYSWQCGPEVSLRPRTPSPLGAGCCAQGLTLSSPTQWLRNNAWLPPPTLAESHDTMHAQATVTYLCCFIAHYFRTLQGHPKSHYYFVRGLSWSTWGWKRKEKTVLEPSLPREIKKCTKCWVCVYLSNRTGSHKKQQNKKEEQYNRKWFIHNRFR